jgi:allantoin racemase
MLIKIINPNTTQYMTKDIYRSAIRCANPGTEIIAVNPQRGPVSIENFCDEYVAAIGVMEEVHKGADQGIDAYIIACFDDPGLYAAREITDVPVVGIAEAAMHLATMVASKFSIITVIPRTRLMLEELVKKYGLEKKCASIRASGMQVLDFERDPIKGKQH